MQLKKTDQNSSPSPSEHSPKPVAPAHAEDIAKKKIISIGVITGIIGAGAAGAWLWNEGSWKKEHQKTNETNISTPLSSQNKTIVAAPAPQPDVHQGAGIVPVATPPQIPANTNEVSLDTPAEQKAIEALDENLPVKKTLKRVKKTPKYLSPDLVSADEINPVDYQYSALSSGPVIYASTGAKVEVSRKVDFKTLYVRGVVDKSGEFRITNPPPGVIYWRIKGGDGVHKIKILEPESTNLELSIPSTLKIGDSIAWKSNTNASFYKIEISKTLGFDDVMRTFSTKETSMNTALIGAGTWFIRLAALNIQSGSFDYTQISPIVIQSQSQDSQPQNPVQLPSNDGNSQINENQTQPTLIKPSTGTTEVPSAMVPSATIQNTKVIQPTRN